MPRGLVPPSRPAWPKVSRRWLKADLIVDGISEPLFAAEAATEPFTPAPEIISSSRRKAQFHDAPSYYATGCDELMHWTGDEGAWRPKEG
jgi:hypothetical protein